jgi:hypothetical protein
MIQLRNGKIIGGSGSGLSYSFGFGSISSYRDDAAICGSGSGSATLGHLATTLSEKSAFTTHSQPTIKQLFHL